MSRSITDRIARLPLPVRHAALVLAAGGLSWAGTELVPWLEGQAELGAVLALALTGALAAVTPLVQGYGLGNRQTDLPLPETDGPLTIRLTAPLDTPDELSKRITAAMREYRERGGRL
ncbi:hypothetical protein [Kineosporia succinea]|uniref:Uncharacterized protein n=1 Tax=Kineosporia succinea TaxID=84632 RepID=A0ABT9P6D1_9ACTN|nr:hypothetical protein [Kineosporia succinea]MDP9828032.1 hypothetical protein [Kineosporia succinea]